MATSPGSVTSVDADASRPDGQGDDEDSEQDHQGVVGIGVAQRNRLSHNVANQEEEEED